MRFSAWYGILVGFLMIAQWTFNLLIGGVPELETAPWEITLHLAAEMTTAGMLILGGIATLKSIHWGKPILLVSLGLVIYSEIISPGYFAQLGQWALVAMFAMLLFGGTISVMMLLQRKTS